MIASGRTLTRLAPRVNEILHMKFSTAARGDAVADAAFDLPRDLLDWAA
jgi:hypothetical protein